MGFACSLEAQEPHKVGGWLDGSGQFGSRTTSHELRPSALLCYARTMREIL